jgi:hypothetical protein
MPTARFGNTNYITIDYPGCQDCDITNVSPLNNSGAAQYLLVGDYKVADPECYSALIAFDLKSFFEDHPDATITAARLKIYCMQRGT